MARAKRTDRAEARRKYRAYLQAQEEAEAVAASGAESPAAASSAPSAKPVRGSERRPQPAVQPGVRLGIVAAARAAGRTPHYLDDVRNVRSLVFGSNAIWPVLVICVLSGAYLAARAGSPDYAGDALAPFLVQFIFLPVPLLPPMMAGFLAPRSTWLAGMLASLISLVVLLAVIGIMSVRLSTLEPIASASPSPQASPAASVTPAPTTLASAASGTISAAPSATPSSSPTASASSRTGSGSGSSGSTASDVLQLTGGGFFMLLFGAMMGALSGWYKRFLSLTSAPRNKPPSRPSGSRSPQRRPATKR